MQYRLTRNQNLAGDGGALAAYFQTVASRSSWELERIISYCHYRQGESGERKCRIPMPMRTLSTAAAGGTILFNPRHLLSLHHAYQSPLPRPQARPKTSIFSGENPLPRSLKPLLLLTRAAESTPPPSAASPSSLLDKTIVSDEEFSLAKVLSFPFLLLFVFIYLILFHFVVIFLPICLRFQSVVLNSDEFG